MADLPLAGKFEQFEMADKVAVAIGARVFDRVSHTGLCAKVDDSVNFRTGNGVGQCGLIGKIDGMKSEVGLLADQTAQARCFQRNRIIIVEIIDANDMLSARQQGTNDMGADKAGGSGDQHRHGIKPYRKRLSDLRADVLRA